MIENSNKYAAAGKGAIGNKLFQWMITQSAKYNFINILIKLIKKILNGKILNTVRQILLHAKGLILEKSKNGVSNGDVRPIVILDALIRLIDKIMIDIIRIIMIITVNY